MTRREDSDADRELLQRCDETTLALDRLCVDRVDRVEGGFAALTPSLPLVWDLNYVIFEKPASGLPRLDPERMAEISDEALGGAGLEHRTVMTSDPAEDARADPGFRRLGWEVEGEIFMVLRSDPGGHPDAGAREVRTRWS